MRKRIISALMCVTSFALTHRRIISGMVALCGGRREFLLWLVRGAIGWGFGLAIRDLWRRAKEYL